MRRVWKIIVVIPFFFWMTGCWDRVEIEERGFVVGVAIDKPLSAKGKEELTKEAPNKPQAKNRYAVTYQIVVPANVTKEGVGGGGSGGSGKGKASMNITSEADSIFEIGREMSTRTSRTPYFEHLKVIVVSEEVAKTGELPTVLDFFLRNPEMRRGTVMLISKGRAKDVLEVEPPNEKLPAIYLQSVSRNTFKAARMEPIVRIGKLQGFMLSKQSYVISAVSPSEKEVKIAGEAIFHSVDNKMLGYLNEEETEGQNFLRGKVKGGLLKIPVKDNLVTYEIKREAKNIKAQIQGKDNIHFTIQIKSEGNIAESMVHLDFLQPNRIPNLERLVEKEILRMTQDSINKIQKDYKADVIGLGEYLENHHHDFWLKVKDNWDQGENYFSKCKIDVEADVRIRNVGIIDHAANQKE
ncbi:MAG TPA: Ger(x)C family spore germination protein [Bacillota bacterium]|nr:Ger(x)C family spore germination protein [Bacillota bacterium]